MTTNQEKNEIKYDAHPVFETAKEEPNNKNLNFFEIIIQALCLVFQLQRRSGLKRATDLLETNPKSMILAGFVSMIIFFSICFISSQLAIKYLSP
ncbi:MAG: hypothetical protein COA46_00900 [Porticoccaceae bacterium]|nr:MAG: hypothetical protein COA46_00900 [Porticoccaceae bacterium]